VPLKRAPLAAGQDFRTDLGHTVLAVAVNEGHDGHLASHRAARGHAAALVLGLVHVAREPGDEGLIDFDLAANLAAVLALHRKADEVEHQLRGSSA